MNTKTTQWGWAALAVLALSACKNGEAPKGTPKLSTVQVSRGDLIIKAEATGSVEPVRSVEVKSKASGEILRLHVDIGDVVQPGALLAEVDPRDVRNKFDQAKADLDVAKARTEITEAQLDRSQELLTAGVIAEQEHETKRLDYANAVANQVKAETNYELAELQLSDVTITAPMKGTIIQKNVEEGQVIQSASGNVSGGTTLFVMANLDQMQVRTLVDETDMGQIRSGLAANVTAEAYPDRTFRGRVEKIEPQATVQQNVTMFPVIVSLDNESGLLRPGMNAEVEILVDQALDVLLVPNSAIVRTQDVGPAALALGLDVESLDLTQFMRAGRNGGQGTGGGTAAQGGAPGGAMGTSDDPQAADPQPASAAPTVGGGSAPGGATAAAQPAASSAASAREVRSVVVFVLGPDSVPEPRLVHAALNDWDNTEIVDGLEGSETLVVVSAAQLQAQQQQWLSQLRSRMGSNPFGGGGPGMGGGPPPGERGGGGRPPGRD